MVFIIDNEDNLWVAGNNSYDQLGLKNTNEANQFTNTNIKVISVSCGYNYTTIIDQDNYLWVTGNNSDGQLGLGNTDKVNQFTKIKNIIPKTPSNRFKKTKSARKID